MKKFLLSLLAIICATTFAFADGQAGPNIEWWYTDTKQLVRFTGYGPMYDFDISDNQPAWWFVNPYYYELADGITTIGNNAFYGFWLKSFNFPASLTSIGDYAFISCSFESKNITLPDNLQTIGDLAFASTNITSVYLGSKVKSLGREAFYSCRKLANFTVSSSNPYFTSVDGVLYNKSMTEVIAFPMGDAKGRTSYVVPDGVTKIGHYAFKPGTYYVCQLTSIELPRTLKEIEGAGLSCYEITSITCAAKNPPVATESSFYEVKTSATITVPTGKTAAYKAAPGWSKFTNYVEKDFPEIIDPTCAVPTNLALVGEPSFSTAEISLTPGSNEQAGWGFRYKKASESEYHNYPNRIANTGKSSYSFTLTNLEPETEYNVVAFGVCADDVEEDILSENSAVFTFTTGKVPAPQNTPTVENDWVYYGTNTFGMSGEVAGDTYWGMMIPTNVAVSKYLDTVALYASSLDEMEISIYTGGNTPDKATKVWSQNVVPTELNTFNYFALVEPIEYVKSKNLWIFFRNTNVYNIPVAYSVGANTPNARWIGIASGDNVTWMDMKDFAPEYSYITWLIDAHFTAKPVYHPYAKDLVAKKVNNNSVTLGWTGRADKFEVRYRKVANPEDEWNLKINIANKSTTISKLEAEKDYEFQVRAKLGDDYSDWSEVLNVFTEDKVAIDQVLEEKAPSTKFMKDGQLFILHDGKIYNASGFRVQ